jgi:hypothetical protein
LTYLIKNILARKLEIYGAIETTTTWVRNYLSGRSQMVEYGGHHSKIKDVMVGSPQRSVLSPLLFLIQTSDMPEAIKRASSSTYADDTYIYTGQQKQEMVYKVLEVAADEVLLYMRANKLAANPEDFFYYDWDKKRHRRSELVGPEFIEENYAEDWLGVKISKNCKASVSPSPQSCNEKSHQSHVHIKSTISARGLWRSN